MNTSEQVTTTDVLIIGAGIAGISAAYHLKTSTKYYIYYSRSPRYIWWHMESI